MSVSFSSDHSNAFQLAIKMSLAAIMRPITSGPCLSERICSKLNHLVAAALFRTPLGSNRTTRSPFVIWNRDTRLRRSRNFLGILTWRQPGPCEQQEGRKRSVVAQVHGLRVSRPTRDRQLRSTTKRLQRRGHSRQSEISGPRARSRSMTIWQVPRTQLDLPNVSASAVNLFRRSGSHAPGSCAFCISRRSRIGGCGGSSARDRNRAAT